MPLTTKHIDSFIRNEKNKLKVDEQMYHDAIKFKNFGALTLLLMNDGDELHLILNKIQSYDLLFQSLKHHEYKLLTEIVRKELLSFEPSILEGLFDIERRNNDVRIIVELLIIKFFKYHHWIFSSSSTAIEIFLLVASKINNRNIMALILNFLFQQPWDAQDCLKSLLNDSLKLKYSIEDLINATDLFEEKPLEEMSQEHNISENSNHLDILKLNPSNRSLTAAKHRIDRNNDYRSFIIENCIKNKSFFSLILNVAIKVENFNIIQYLIENENLKSKVDINSRDKNLDYPLIIALNNIKIFHYLLDHGGHINIENSKGVPLLTVALQNKQYMAVKTIFHYKNIENINNAIIGQNSYTFHTNSKPLIIQYLFNSSFNLKEYIEENRLSLEEINKIDQYGYSLLHYCILKEDVTSVNYLVDRGAEVNFVKNKNGDGHSSIEIAIHIGHKDIFFSLLQSVTFDVNRKNSREEIPLTTLLKNQHFSLEDKMMMIESLLIKGSQINILDYENMTSVLVYAIQFSSLPIVQLLVSYEADINSIDFYKNSPLTYAIQEKSLPIVEFLLDHGADPNFIDFFNISVLAYAIQSQFLSIVECLVRHGADVNFILKKNCYLNHNHYKYKYQHREKTMLNFAIELGNLSIVQCLIESHAVMNREESNEIIDIFHNSKNIDLFTYLLEQKVIGAMDNERDGVTMLNDIILNDDVDLFKVLVEHGIDIEQLVFKDYTPLLYALDNCKWSIVKYLITIGADIQPVNEHIMILKRLITYGKFDILSLLLSHHVDINREFENGNTLLAYTILTEGALFVVYLLDVGADFHRLKGRKNIITSLKNILIKEPNEKIKMLLDYLDE